MLKDVSDTIVTCEPVSSKQFKKTPFIVHSTIGNDPSNFPEPTFESEPLTVWLWTAGGWSFPDSDFGHVFF